MRATPNLAWYALVLKGNAPTFGFKKTHDVKRTRAKRVRAPNQACSHRGGAHRVGHKE
jgi:hypothetical protein